MGDRTYLKKTTFRTAGTSTPVVSRSTVVARKNRRELALKSARKSAPPLAAVHLKAK